jgi:hypothetical protein
MNYRCQRVDELIVASIPRHLNSITEAAVLAALTRWQITIKKEK